MKLQVRATPDVPPKSGTIVTIPNGHLLLVEGEEYGTHDRRLRELEVVSATDRERDTLRKKGYRILGL